MAEIELVIKLDEEVYKKLIKYGEPSPCGNLFDDAIMKAVANGTPLPKGHGWLIDAGEHFNVLNDAQIEGLNTYKGLGRAKELLLEAPTLIEADTNRKE